jgi:hypothetical protein
METGKAERLNAKCTVGNEQLTINRQKAHQRIRTSVGGRSDYQKISLKIQTQGAGCKVQRVPLHGQKVRKPVWFRG